ncbi:MAG: hypothetical protein ABI780_04570 [Ardenticatenales bacterium]
MPDWSYQPLLRPLLFRLPAAVARDGTLHAIAALAATPFGPAAIDALGHMGAPEGIGRAAFGSRVVSPIGLSAGFDSGAVAPAALGRFGFGWLEVGPVAFDPPPALSPTRDAANGALRFPAGLPAADAHVVAHRLADRRPPPGVRLAVRLRGAGWRDGRAPAEIASLAGLFAPVVDALVIEMPFDAHEPGEGHGLMGSVVDRVSAEVKAAVAGVVAAAVAARRAARDRAPSVLIALPPDVDERRAERWATAALAAGAEGVVVGGGVGDGHGGRVVGGPARAGTIAMIGRLRAAMGPGVTLVAGDGVIEPGDALAMLAAGADLVGLHAGLVYSGPGLPKRINEALLLRGRRDKSAERSTSEATRDATGIVAVSTTNVPSPSTPNAPSPSPRPWWIAYAFIAVTMTVAGLLAGAVALTAVVLPYDLRWVGLTRADLAAANPRLMDFMAHDRLSLAGTMVSLGLLYAMLTAFGVRRGVHWAARAMGGSIVVGLASFFLFLSHGYLDPLHAVLSGTIALLFVLGRRWPAASPPDVPAPDLVNDAAWRRAMAGQLALVLLAVGLVGGGLTIAFVGGSRVFVGSDLAFMHTTYERLAAVSRRLLPLIAHDRAGFGGALVATGVASGGVALWGFRRGASWVWWTVLLSGLPGLAGTLAIHAAVGYTNAAHLAPVVSVGALYAVGLGASWSYLCDARS